MDGLVFVQKIEAELMRQGISKEKFYKESGISSATMSQWRQGVYFPSRTAIEKIEQYLGIVFSVETKDDISDNKTLYEKILYLCNLRGIKPGRLCSELGLSRSIMSDMKMGRTKSLSAKNSKIIADYLGVSVGYLLGEEEKENSPNEFVLTEGERELISLYRQIPNEHRLTVLQMILFALTLINNQQ